MKKFMSKIRPVVGWVWGHTAAGVGLLLIVVALVVGYRLGRPAPVAPDAIVAGVDVGDGHDGAETGKVQMYTCAMHPSVRLEDPDARCPICSMELIPVVERGGDGPENQITMSESAAALSRIETAAVVRMFPVASVRMYGKLTYDQTSVARLTAYFPGRIDRLFVNYIGVPMGEGDHVAEVYSPELLAVFEELRQSSMAAGSTGGTSDLIREASAGTLSAAREKLRLFGLTAGQIESIEAGTYDSDVLTVFSPIGGVVTHLAVREGDYVETGDAIATVADLSRLWLDLEAYESQLPLLRWGQRVTFSVEAQPGEVFEGRVSFIEPMVDPSTRTSAVRVAVDNTAGRLKPGMFASAVVRARLAGDGVVVSEGLAGKWVSPMHPTVVKDGPGLCDLCGMEMVPAESFGALVELSAAAEPLVVPRSAVLFTGSRSVVYLEVVGAEVPTYEGREVLLGALAGEYYLVREGLVEGEMVVVNGAFRIDSAMQIMAKPSMMSSSGGRAPNVHGGHGSMASDEMTAGEMTGEESDSEIDNGPVVLEVPEVFAVGLGPVYGAYLGAQEALAGDDLGGFVRAAGELEMAVGMVEEAGLSDEALEVWGRESARLIGGGASATIEEARAGFEAKSLGVITLQREFGNRGDEGLHVAFCPMAFDFKGAEWLQLGEQINNPYFGASMLRCGEIREVLEPVSGMIELTPPSDEHEGHDHE